jgi:eukaryotic-like serine/threonine-protein kinase
LLYLVMEWIDGHSLAELGRKVAPIREASTMGVLLRILSDVCAGLHAAHELCDRNGTPLFIVHRDVSPTNILIDRHGVARLIDFGLAKPTREARAGSHPDLLKGKVTYMAPEYVRDRRVDRRGDVWAIGVILYRFLSGRSPFHMESQMAVLRSLAAGAAPPPLPATVPSSVVRIVERALMPDLEHRFASAAELQEAIEATLVELRTPTTSQTVAAFVGANLVQRIDATVSVLADRRDSARPSVPSPGLAEESSSEEVRIPTGFRALRFRSVYVLMLVLLVGGAALAAAAVWTGRILPREGASTDPGANPSEPPAPSAIAPVDHSVSVAPFDSTRRTGRAPADPSAKTRPKPRITSPPQPKQTDPADDFGI